MTFLDKYNKFLKKKNKNELQRKVYFSVSSEGYGHSSRILAIAREFKPEEIMVGSYNYAYERFVNDNCPCVKLDQEIKFIGQQGAFDVGKTIIKNHSLALKFNKLVKNEIEIIKKSGASCVVADGRLVPVMAAEKLSLPCIVITNQSAFYPFFARDTALVRVLGRSFDWIMKTWLSSTEEIMIPDFPPPYTICIDNLSHNFKVKKRTRFVGPLVYWNNDEIIPVDKPSESKPYIIITLGGHAYRKPILDHVIEVARQMPDIDFDIFTSFSADNLPENVRIPGMVANLPQYMKSADLIITQAGHSTAMELMTLGKPSIIIPDLNQIEQENNASKMKSLEVAEIISHKELNCDKLISVINLMLKSQKYTENATKFAEMAKEINGRKKAAEILSEYAGRLGSY